MDLRPKDAGLRIVDISKCLQEVSIGTPHFHFRHADEIGGAVRLAQSIKGTESLSAERLEAVGTRIGMKPADVTNTSVPILEDLGWISLHKDNSGRISIVDENIPIVGDVFKAAGSYFLERDPPDVEFAGVGCLSVVSRCPLPLNDVEASVEVDSADLQLMLEQGIAGQFLDEYRYGADRIIYTPFLWDSPSVDVLKTIGNLTDEDRGTLLTIATLISQYPGLPLEKLGTHIVASEKNRTLAEATRCGLIGSTNIVSLTCESHEFLFLPSRKMRIPAEGEIRNDVFNRVRALISCVRQGQHFASRTKIRSPIVVLQSLLDNGYIGKTPHRDLKDQYSILEPWLGTAARAFGERYTFQFNRNPENEQIVKLAIDILEEPEIVTNEATTKEVKELVGQGDTFVGPEATRIRKSPGGPVPKGTARIMEIIRGERHD
ncbi:MAG: hypothetical protein MUO81_08230 [Thermoplasmata archaeon]|nr:hypothetical protein [Thermoplasmata archaeon]